MSTRIPHLPDEIHLLIGQYVHRDDLASYRLASKLLLSIGTPELFGTLIFHYSTASLARLASIGNCDHLRKHVETVFWDINLWRIPNVRDFVEWQACFRRKATFLRVWNGVPEAEEQARRLDLLAENRKEWVAYLDKVDDEKQARRDPSRLDALQRFYNLHTIHIVHGKLVPAHRGIRKVSNEIESASVEPVMLRRGEGMNDFGSQTGNEAIESLRKLTIPRLTKLKLDRIHYTNFITCPVGQFDNLKSLDIKITARADSWHTSTRIDRRGGSAPGPYTQCYNAASLFHQGTFRLFLLHLLPQLECLKIDLDCTNEKMAFASRQPMAYMRDIFDTYLTWPRLRKLSLCHFFATPETLITLLTRHRGTLKDLRLCNIVLERMLSGSEGDDSGDDPVSSVLSLKEYGWPEILQHLTERLELQHATLSGQLATTGSHQGSWDLDANPEYAAAISNYLVRGGARPW